MPQLNLSKPFKIKDPSNIPEDMLYTLVNSYKRENAYDNFLALLLLFGCSREVDGEFYLDTKKTKNVIETLIGLRVTHDEVDGEYISKSVIKSIIANYIYFGTYNNLEDTGPSVTFGTFSCEHCNSNNTGYQNTIGIPQQPFMTTSNTSGLQYSQMPGSQPMAAFPHTQIMSRAPSLNNQPMRCRKAISIIGYMDVAMKMFVDSLPGGPNSKINVSSMSTNTTPCLKPTNQSIDWSMIPSMDLSVLEDPTFLATTKIEGISIGMSGDKLMDLVFEWAIDVAKTFVNSLFLIPENDMPAEEITELAHDATNATNVSIVIDKKISKPKSRKKSQPAEEQ